MCSRVCITDMRRVRGTILTAMTIIGTPKMGSHLGESQHAYLRICVPAVEDFEYYLGWTPNSVRATTRNSGKYVEVPT